MAMSRYRDLVCEDEARRALLRKHATLNGIDYIEVSADSLDAQHIIDVYFIKPQAPAGLADRPELFRIDGGVRIRNIRVDSVKRKDDGHLEVKVDRAGDFSTYTLIVNSEAIDPAYAQCEFSFKAGCPSRFDRKPRAICPTEPRSEPLVDYMAKDYASFRQALLDLIPTLMPDWKERHEADPGIALVELLAYVGDQLSYYQDAVANEAYLETSRQRISVRRHARLIDYHMHDGASACAFVHFCLKKGAGGTLPEKTPVLTCLDVPLGAAMPPHGPVIRDELKDQALKAADAVFETMAEAHLHSNLNEITIHTWGNRECCLPRGTTTVDLRDDLAFDPTKDELNGTRGEVWRLKRGDFLLFEEVFGPETGLEADANPEHRQIVRLTDVQTKHDPVEGVDLTRVTWDFADRLSFPLCVSARLTKGQRYEPAISVARGNLVPADHGRTMHDPSHPGPRTASHPRLRRAHRIRLREGPLSFRIPVRDQGNLPTPVKELLKTDPKQAIPQVTRLAVTSAARTVDWDDVVPHLLDSSPSDHDCVVETDNESRAIIRFGDNEYGAAPPDGSDIAVTYRVGVGRAGNVGAESLSHIVKKDHVERDPLVPDIAPTLQSIAAVRNPLPAWGGIDPQPIEDVKQLAPAAFHAEPFRAVTEADYARVAEKHPKVSKAVATFRWTGSWHTVFVTIDPEGRTDIPSDLKREVTDCVTGHTLAGYDLELNSPIYTPLDIAIDVCVAPNHFRAHVEEALLLALSNQTLPDGKRGFFHPDNFTFGQPLYLSQLYAAIEAVKGVDSAAVTTFQRFAKAPDNELEQGYIPMGRLEVVRLDNDPNFPENGVLGLNMLGGK